MSELKQSSLRGFFGQFSEPGFYIDLLKMAVTEILKAATLAFAGTITYYVQQRLVTGPNTRVPQPDNNSLSQRAFGSSDNFSRNDSFSRQSNYYPAQTQATSFPGFGNR